MLTSTNIALHFPPQNLAQNHHRRHTLLIRQHIQRQLGDFPSLWFDGVQIRNGCKIFLSRLTQNLINILIEISLTWICSRPSSSQVSSSDISIYSSAASTSVRNSLSGTLESGDLFAHRTLGNETDSIILGRLGELYVVRIHKLQRW